MDSTFIFNLIWAIVLGAIIGRLLRRNTKLTKENKKLKIEIEAIRKVQMNLSINIFAGLAGAFLGFKYRTPKTNEDEVLGSDILLEKENG